MKIKPPDQPLTFGFDIGIASVGWAVLAPDRIVALGVRAFDKAETAKEGDSLNEVRRTARLMRRRLHRRAVRLAKLARTFKRIGLIDDARMFQQQRPYSKSLWQLRVEALDRRLDDEEWARVIYHLCKHRGFHWISRAEEKAAEDDTKGEGGKVKQGLATTSRLMHEHAYRTAAEMVLSEFPKAQRNKYGDYSKAVSRIQLSEEMTLLFRRQRELQNSHAGSELEAFVLGNGDRKSGLFWEQEPALAGAALLKMLGYCTFEKQEHRAPKASFSAERHVWLTRLNNLRITVDGTTRPLNAFEREIALPLPYTYDSDLTYKRLRNALVKACAVPNAFTFAGLPYPTPSQLVAGKTKDPEAVPLIKIPAWHSVRSTLEKAGLDREWQKLSTPALEGDGELLDQVAWVLSVYKENDEVAAELRKLPLPNPEKVIEALLDIRFDKFHALSLKALRKIVPFMESGLRYDEACTQAGYVHSVPSAEGDGQRYLPPLYSGRDKLGRMTFAESADIPRNPVVLRALNQARKVLNALVRVYGSPSEVHIEMARDLSRPLDERRKIQHAQEEYRERNLKTKQKFVETFDIIGSPRGRDFEKWQLYEEQLGKCAYSTSVIDIHRLFEPGYVEIDHVLPYSRSFDDSKNNKVLVHAKENRDKGNRTPYEYLGGERDDPRWRTFAAFVESTKAFRLAKRTRLLRKDFGEKEAEEFRDRNLNDTRYICRFFKSYVERYLKLADGSDAKRCVVLSGQLTSFLRARWGLLKIRSESDRHHALDAAIVAACSHSMVKRLSDYSRRKELDQVHLGFADPATGEVVDPAMYQRLNEHFPDPFPHFRQELEARLKIDDPAVLRTEIELLGTYPSSALDELKPLFVSRAPLRRSGGAAHKETIYSQPKRLKVLGAATQRKSLSSLTLKDLDTLVDPQRNEKLYAAIRARLEANGGNGEKAFPTGNPLRKPDHDGNATGPIVRSVTMQIEKVSGIPVRGGIARNDTMLRVDVFSKAGKFYLIPIYVNAIANSPLPNRAIVQGRDESDWTEIDNSFSWQFSLYPNDFVRIAIKGATYEGYFAGCDRSTGAVSLWSHDRSSSIGIAGLVRSIGVKTAQRVEKFNVDVLGNRYVARHEERRGLA